MKKLIWNILIVLILFILQIGASVFFGRGWVLNLLIPFTIIAIWLNSHQAIKYQLLPAAILIDTLQTSKLPIMTITLLGVWLTVAIVENQWLTNRSIASLFGLALIGGVIRFALTGGLIGLAYLLNFSNTKPGSTWSSSQISFLFLIEIGITFFGGLIANWLVKNIIQKSLYAKT